MLHDTRKWFALGLALLVVLSGGSGLRAQNSEPAEEVVTELVTYRIEKQHETVNPGEESALAVRFSLSDGWHFYASADDAPGGMNLTLTPEGPDSIKFHQPIFPPSGQYYETTLQRYISVFSKDFSVYIPFEVSPDAQEDTLTVTVDVDGAVCTDEVCRVPTLDAVSTQLRIDADAQMQANFEIDEDPEAAAAEVYDGGQWAAYGWWLALPLALVAGLALNLMPCVWPVLPIIVMRLIDQSQSSRGKSVTLGLAFSGGILGFFAVLAVANIILQLFYQTALQWGDQFRSPAFLVGMSLLLIVLALFMFGLINFNLPGSVSQKAAAGKGYAGSIGMGFLAAILSTPCSFAILAAAFAWAQAQPLALGTVAIMVIGLGMAVPYIILTSLPGLLQKLPRGGQWLEIFKQAVGFILLGIAVKLIVDLPADRISGTLYYAVILSFAAWMWGSWISFNTKALRKWIIRGSAIIIAVIGGWALLAPPQPDLIDWQPYDRAVIDQAIEEDRPVLIKFTADWCVSCQVAERIVYSRSDVADLIEQKNVLPIKADTTTREMPATQALSDIYNEPGIPVSILILPDRDDDIRWRGVSFAQELKDSLETIRNE